MKYNPIRGARKLIKRINNQLSGKSVVNYKGRGTINLIDVGSLGSLPEPWNSNMNRISYLLSFEPLEGKEESKQIIKRSEALWKEDAVLPFYIYKGFKSSGSSLFEANVDFVKENYNSLKDTGPLNLAKSWFERAELLKKIDIECTTLDNVLSGLNVDLKFDFLKIDVQGAEYEILEGAKSFLMNDCVGLQLELFKMPLYKNIHLKDDVILLLEKFGFDLVKVFPPHGTFDSQNDHLFLRRDTNPEQLKIKEELMKIYDVRS